MRHSPAIPAGAALVLTFALAASCSPQSVPARPPPNPSPAPTATVAPAARVSANQPPVEAQLLPWLKEKYGAQLVDSVEVRDAREPIGGQNMSTGSMAGGDAQVAASGVLEVEASGLLLLNVSPCQRTARILRFYQPYRKSQVGAFRCGTREYPRHQVIQLPPPRQQR